VPERANQSDQAEEREPADPVAAANVPVAAAEGPPTLLDPEDWTSSKESEDGRYLRERPPHWQ
jgi:hypothetical protein